LLTTRYKWSDDDAVEFADFLLPMLNYDPRRRATAEQCLRHPWLHARQPPPPSSAAADSGWPPPVQRDSAPAEAAPKAAVPEVDADAPAPDTGVVDANCDATSRNDKGDALSMTPPSKLDRDAELLRNVH